MTIMKIDCAAKYSDGNSRGVRNPHRMILVRHCMHFPMIYQFRDSGAITVWVCIVMHSPPSDRKQENRKKLIADAPIPSRLQQPLDISRIPYIVIFTISGNLRRNHLSQIAVITRNRMIHPQIAPIFFTDWIKTVVMGVVFGSVLTAAVLPRALGRSRNVRSAERMCTIHRIQESFLENKAPPIPNRNAGPALLQKPSICSACCFLNWPLR